MQRRLINHRSHQHGRAVRLTLHGQLSKPLRPVVVEVSLHAQFVGVAHGTVLTSSRPRPPLVAVSVARSAPPPSITVTKENLRSMDGCRDQPKGAEGV